MERGRWTTSDVIHPDVQKLGSTRFLKAELGGLRPHVHSRAWEIVLVLAGTVEWWVGPSEPEGERWTVGPGSYFLTRPDEPHGGQGDVMNPCELQWMVVSDRRASSWLDGVPRSGPAGSTARQAYAALIDEHRRPGQRARELIEAWLVVALSSLSSAPSDVEDLSLFSVIEAVRADLGDRWSVQRLADLAGYSVPRFCVRFRAAFGQSPARWLRHERVAAARALLAAGCSVSQTAVRVGFATSQHFAYVFRSETGLSPSEYVARASAYPSSGPVAFG